MPRIIKAVTVVPPDPSIEIKDIKKSIVDITSSSSNLNREQLEILNKILGSLNQLLTKLDNQNQPELWTFDIQRNSDGSMKTIKAKKG
jgi:ATP phosphoribosyltransferase